VKKGCKGIRKCAKRVYLCTPETTTQGGKTREKFIKKFRGKGLEYLKKIKNIYFKILARN